MGTLNVWKPVDRIDPKWFLKYFISCDAQVRCFVGFFPFFFFVCLFGFVCFLLLFVFGFCFLLGSVDLDSPTQQLALLAMYKAKYVLKQYGCLHKCGVYNLK